MCECFLENLKYGRDPHGEGYESQGLPTVHRPRTIWYAEGQRPRMTYARSGTGRCDYAVLYAHDSLDAILLYSGFPQTTQVIAFLG